MFGKKFILGLFIISFISACTSPTALLGPTYTLTSTGNIFQAGLSYGSQELVKKHTGKTPLENLIEMSSSENEENIQKKTLESEDFYILLKNKIEKTGEILKLSN